MVIGEEEPGVFVLVADPSESDIVTRGHASVMNDDGSQRVQLLLLSQRVTQSEAIHALRSCHVTQRLVSDQLSIVAISIHVQLVWKADKVLVLLGLETGEGYSLDVEAETSWQSTKGELSVDGFVFNGLFRDVHLQQGLE